MFVGSDNHRAFHRYVQRAYKAHLQRDVVTKFTLMVRLGNRIYRLEAFSITCYYWVHSQFTENIKVSEKTPFGVFSDKNIEGFLTERNTKLIIIECF